MVCRNIAVLALSAMLGACGTPAPKVIPGKGAVYGTVETRPHKEFVAKVTKPDMFSTDPQYVTASDGRIVFSADMVNYNELDDVHVGIIGGPRAQNPRTHRLVVGAKGPEPRSLALAPGDLLQIQNSTPAALTLFLSDRDDDDKFQDIPALEPGGSRTVAIALAGNLEINSEDDERFRVAILSRHGLLARRLRSGAPYQFTNLEPGSYRILFWYWRLGMLEHQVQVEPGRNLRLDETLSVDRIVH